MSKVSLITKIKYRKKIKEIEIRLINECGFSKKDARSHAPGVFQISKDMEKFNKNITDVFSKLVDGIFSVLAPLPWPLLSNYQIAWYRRVMELAEKIEAISGIDAKESYNECSNWAKSQPGHTYELIENRMKFLLDRLTMSSPGKIDIQSIFDSEEKL